MTPFQPNRRSFFGGISALFLGMFLHKKVAASAPPPPPPATPSVPTPPAATPYVPPSYCSVDEGFGNAITLSYSSLDDYVESPTGLGDSCGITYTYTE